MSNTITKYTEVTMSNKKQSSVDYLVNQLEFTIGKNVIILMEYEIEQAKAMHEQEIINSYRGGIVYSFEKYVEGSNITITSEQYYNDTFNSDEA